MTPPRPTRVALTMSVVRTIAAESRASTDGTETGGILLGRTIGDTVVIRHAGSPGPRAIRTPTFFLRDLQHAEVLAAEVFDLDNSVWIGEWHTHLDAPALPSRRDLTTYLRLLGDPDLAFETFVALIAVPAANGWIDPYVTAWVIRRDEVWSAGIEIISTELHHGGSGR